MIKQLEELMYLMSDFFLAPVLILLVILFIYSLYAVGGFAAMALQRRRARSQFEKLSPKHRSINNVFVGYPLVQAWLRKPSMSQDELDVAALKELELVRMVSRLAPMLGLIATMVPMGPALKSLSNGNVQGISENLIIAFSAVIFGLVVASITFWIATIKKRWLATELVRIQALANEDLHLERGDMREAA